MMASRWKLLCFFVLFLAFGGNVFGVGPSGWFADFREGSSPIVTKTAECKGTLDYNGPILRAAEVGAEYENRDNECRGERFIPYYSQFGLQARTVAFFAPSGDLAAYFHTVEMILAGLMAILMTLFIFKVKELFNSKAAIVVSALIALSLWIVGYASNMYWVAFLMFAPFVFGFVWYLKFRNTKRVLLFYALLGILFLLKLLNGYEHITVVIVSAFVPIVYYELVDGKQKLLDLWKKAAAVVGVGIIAFVCALCINVASMSGYYGSWQKALSMVASRAEARSVSFTEYQSKVVPKLRANAPATYSVINNIYPLEVLEEGKGHPLKYALLSLVNYLMLPAISLPVVIKGFIGEMLQSVLAFSLVSFWALKYIVQRKIVSKKIGYALRQSYFVGLAGALSWLILMPGHSYVHPHLNGIIFYIPLLLICYIILGLLLSGTIDKARRKAKNAK